MERVLVTGAGGYIGTTLVPMLLEAGYRVRAVDRFFFGAGLLPEHERLERVRADSRWLGPEVFEGVDHVVDLVAISNDPSGERFADATFAINHRSRARTAAMAKAAGARRYVLPSSCSVYGFQDPGTACGEAHPINPLTTYAKANALAERDVLPLAGEDFCVVVLRQATVYGYSPRMRFDLAVNGMTYGAWKDGVLPLMRDGTQWRPMVHVRDAARAQLFMLTAPREAIDGRVFNVGSEANNYRLGRLAEEIAAAMPCDVRIEWYGDPDHRSYRVDFREIEALGWKAELTARDCAAEIYERLESGALERTPQSITLAWYEQLVAWHRTIKEVELHGGILDV